MVALKGETSTQDPPLLPFLSQPFPLLLFPLAVGSLLAAAALVLRRTFVSLRLLRVDSETGSESATADPTQRDNQRWALTATNMMDRQRRLLPLLV